MRNRVAWLVLVCGLMLSGVRPVQALDLERLKEDTRINRELLMYILTDDLANLKVSDEELLSRIIPLAESGDPGAMTAAGGIYYLGRQIPQDTAKAVYYYSRAAKQGYDFGYVMLGYLYVDGAYHGDDIAKIIEGAERGIRNNTLYKANATLLLAGLRKLGEYEPEDMDEFVAWLESESADQYIQYYLGDIYYQGDGVEQNYAKAFYWSMKSAEQGFDNAEFNVGVLYFDGLGVEQDYAKSFYWFQKAAEQGVAEGELYSGLLYYRGFGVEQNYVQAAYWLKKYLAVGSDPIAKLFLGRCYYLGEGVEKNDKGAFRLYKEAYAAGELEAAGDLGYLYFNGYGVEQDYNTAKELFEIAYQDGNAAAAGMLGVMYEMGCGVEPDKDKAIEYYKIAVDGGDKGSKKYLDDLLSTANDK